MYPVVIPARLSIPDYLGVHHDYACQVVKQWEEAAEPLRVDIERLDTGARYSVVCLRGGTWTCDCPDHTKRARECKHMKAIKGLFP